MNKEELSQKQKYRELFTFSYVSSAFIKGTDTDPWN